MTKRRRALYAVAVALVLGGCGADEPDLGRGGGEDASLPSDVGLPPDLGPDRDDGLAPDGGADPLDMGEVEPPDMGAMEMAEVEPVHPNTLSPEALFTCDGQPSSSPIRIRRLNRIEWTRNVGQSASSPAARNPLDPDPGHPYPTYDRGGTLDAATVDQYLGVNRIPGGSWVARYGNPRLDLVIAISRELTCMQNAENVPDEACVESFVRTYLTRGVLFRPPTDDEVAFLVAFALENVARETPDGPTRANTIVKIGQAAWMTTGALFRTELGGEPEADGRRHLTDHELALALSYALSDRAPGAPIYIWPFSTPEGFLADIGQAALDGTISDPAVIAALVRSHAGGIDPGSLGSMEDPDDLPPEIEALEDPARGAAIARRAGRLDLRQDFDARRRARRAEFYVSDKIRGFFRAWLDYENVSSVFKDRPEATSRFDEGDTSVYRPILGAWNNAMGGYYGHEPILIQLLDDIIARVVVEDRAVLRTLLTTRQFYLPSSVSGEHGGASVSGYLYDIDTEANPIDDTRAARWTVLPEAQRSGVLTHPAWLAAHGGNFENDPSVIHRGKWVREKLLCGLVPDVPITVDAQLDPETVHQSARARVAAKTGADECSGCHALMNPLGYAFEIYNHAGYLRAEDHGGPPDGTSRLLAMPEAALEGEVRDAVEMMALLAESPTVKRCFIRQSFRHFMGRDETLADACTLAAMESTYDDSGGSMIDMLVTLFTSDTFLYRHIPEEVTP